MTSRLFIIELNRPHLNPFVEGKKCEEFLENIHTRRLLMSGENGR